jgi:inorganic triphosphatase YgiF
MPPKLDSATETPYEAHSLQKPPCAMKKQNPAAAIAGKLLSVPAPASRSNASEVELKFLVTEATLKAVQQSALFGSPTRRNAQRLQSVYFDTERGDLGRHHTFLRVRSQRGARLMALKADGADPANPFVRHEIEVPSRSADPDPAALGEAAAAEIERVTEGRPLLPRFTTDIRRTVHRVTAGASEIEVAFDTGSIMAGDARAPVREIELELKSGDAADLFGLGLALTDMAPVRLGIMSKAERGMLLSSGGSAAEMRADSPISADHSVDDIIGATIGACIRQFIGNWPAFETSAGPEPVHQMRVSMRRLRAALTLFNREFPCVEFGVLRGDAKRIASGMSEARNWDVFAGLVQTGPGVVFQDERGLVAVAAACEAHRGAGYEAVDLLLKDVGTTRFVLSALAFVARRGWRNTVPGVDLPRLSASAAGFAALSVDRLHRRVRKRGRHILEMPADERHDLRVELKRLRYATDFFGSLFPNTSAVRTYTRAAAKLQEVLGVFNDMVMVTELVQRLQLGGDLPAIRAAGIVIGWYGHGGQTDNHALRDAWCSFHKAKPFWNDALREAAVTSAQGAAIGRVTRSR